MCVYFEVSFLYALNDNLLMHLIAYANILSSLFLFTQAFVIFFANALCVWMCVYKVLSMHCTCVCVWVVTAVYSFHSCNFVYFLLSHSFSLSRSVNSLFLIFNTIRLFRINSIPSSISLSLLCCLLFYFILKFPLLYEWVRSLIFLLPVLRLRRELSLLAAPLHR